MFATRCYAPGDAAILEAPTWPGVLDALESRRMRVIGLPLDSEGRRADALMQALVENRPKLSYALPTFHNPTGSVMSGARRREVIALAHRYSVPGP